MNRTTLYTMVGAIIVLGGILLALPETRKKETGITPTSETPRMTETKAQTVPEGAYVIAAEKSTAIWEGRKPLLANYTDTGTLSIKSGSFVVANEALTSGTIVFDMQTIHTLSTGRKTGESIMEKHLKSDAFFNVEQHPTAEFQMKEAIAGTQANQYTIKGDLTIKGITNPVAIPVTIAIADTTMTIDSAVTLDRTKWDIRYGSGKFFQNLADNIIDDNFLVTFKLVAETK